MYTYDYVAAFTAAALWIFVPSVPLPHALGLVAHCPKAAKFKHLLLYPAKGGKHHLIFQVISWVSWCQQRWCQVVDILPLAYVSGAVSFALVTCMYLVVSACRHCVLA